MKEEEILDFITNFGKIFLECGAETYRVEDTVSRILSSFNLYDFEVFATSTGIFVSIGKHTKIRRVKTRKMDISKIIYINEISREIVSKEINFDEARLQIKCTVSYVYNSIVRVILEGFGCFFIALLLKGTIKDAIGAFIVGALLNLTIRYLNSKKTTPFLTTCVGGALIAFVTLILINIGIGYLDNIIIASVMPLVPGVTFTNAIRDIFEGDYISGGSRLFEAIVIGINIATGVGIVLSIWISIFDNFYIW